jgi:hypothetical protein
MSDKRRKVPTRQTLEIAAALLDGMRQLAVWGCQPIQQDTMFPINAHARMNHLHLVR